ncbi:FAD-dependent oxidoreductase [Edaphobacter sp. HDX4]
MSPRPHVIIVGGGFGGLAAARALRNASARTTLIDRRNEGTKRRSDGCNH